MIKDKITPQIRKKFLNAIKSTKETGKEHGFHMCIEDNGKLSPTDMCIGNECSIKLHQIHMPCSEKRLQGDFHTHPYLIDAKKYFNITYKGSSDQLIKSAIRQFLDKQGRTITTPSRADVIDAILGKCSKKTEGTTCIGSDLDDSKVECWTPKDIDDADCLRALVDRLGFNVDRESTLPLDWMRHLFDIDMIELKNIRDKSHKR